LWKELIGYQLDVEPFGLLQFPSINIARHPHLHLGVDARGVLNSVAKHCIELTLLLVRVVQHDRILQRRHRSEKRPQVAQIDGAEENDV